MHKKMQFNMGFYFQYHSFPEIVLICQLHFTLINLKPGSILLSKEIEFRSFYFNCSIGFIIKGKYIKYQQGYWM
jgi:hypothetical protein